MAKPKVIREKLGYWTTLRLVGRFDGLPILNAKDRLLAEVNDEAAPELVLDMADTDYIDSAGIGVLLEMAKKASEKKIRFGLVNVREPVKKILAVTKVDKILVVMG